MSPNDYNLFRINKYIRNAKNHSRESFFLFFNKTNLNSNYLDRQIDRKILT